MIPLSNKIARKPQPITKKERLKGAALWGVQALVVPSIHASVYLASAVFLARASTSTKLADGFGRQLTTLARCYAAVIAQNACSWGCTVEPLAACLAPRGGHSAPRLRRRRLLCSGIRCCHSHRRRSPP